MPHRSAMRTWAIPLTMFTRTRKQTSDPHTERTGLSKRRLTGRALMLIGPGASPRWRTMVAVPNGFTWHIPSQAEAVRRFALVRCSVWKR